MTTTSTKPERGRRRNRRGQGVLLREDIVLAGRRLLEERGDEEAVTLRGVAREVGIAAPSIYAHFPSSEAIIWEIVAETFDALTATLRTSREGIDDPVERLSAQCHAYLRFAAEHPGLYRVLFARSRVSGAHRTEDMGQETRERTADVDRAGAETFAMLVGVIGECVRAGRSGSQNPFVDAVALWSALHGYIQLRSATPEFPWPDERATVDAMIAGQARLLPSR